MKDHGLKIAVNLRLSPYFLPMISALGAMIDAPSGWERGIHRNALVALAEAQKASEAARAEIEFGTSGRRPGERVLT